MDWLLTLVQSFVNYMRGEGWRPDFPHPEEPFDPTQTATTDINAIRETGFDSYKVPDANRPFWRSRVEVIFSSALSNPCWKWTDDKGDHIGFNIGWANAGSIIYEYAHICWELLIDEQKTTYQVTFNQLKDSDPMLIALFKKYPHELVADEDTSGDIRIGGHAIVCRMLGEKMPEPLKQFYKNLF